MDEAASVPGSRTTTIGPILPSAAPPAPPPRVNFTLQLPPDLFNGIEAAAAKHGTSASGLVVALLSRVLHLGPSDAWFPVDPATRVELQKVLGGGTITTPEKLLARVQALSVVKIGAVTLYPTEGQLHELRRRARANRRKPEDELKRAFEEIGRLVFGYV